MQLRDDSDDESLHIGRVNELKTDEVRFMVGKRPNSDVHYVG